MRARDHAGVVDVLAGAAGALAVGRRAMIVELEGDPDDVVALRLEQRRGHRGIDAARHGDDDPDVLRTALDFETVEHRLSVTGRTAAPSERPCPSALSICSARPGRNVGAHGSVGTL